LKSTFEDYFGVRHVFFLNSGKSALTTILSGLSAGCSRRQVVIPAYTCYSVPSAVHKAGLEVILCDVDPQSLDFNLVGLRAVVGPDTLAVVVPHLFGQPADLTAVTAIAKSAGAYVVEDAAQAMGGRDQGRWLGTQGDVGFFSFGRGKNVSAGSGGVIVTNSNRIADALSALYQGLPSEHVTSLVINALVVAATLIFLRPALYWLPAGLPFLGLGETRYDPNFRVCRMDGMRAGFLLSWRRRLEESNRCRLRHKQLFDRRLPPIAHVHARAFSNSVYLRLPLLMPNASIKQALCQMANNRGLGISASYPAPASRIPEIASCHSSGRFPGAEMLAAQLVTLPLHQYVSQGDVDRIVEAVGSVSGAYESICGDQSEPVPMGVK
jgi:dTDP-4-amino-4,6-dideoxygalactose transaminase